MNIYDTYVVVKDTKEAEKLKALCIDHNLAVDDSECGFEVKTDPIVMNQFYYYEPIKRFTILFDAHEERKTKVTLAAWIRMLKAEKRKIP